MTTVFRHKMFGWKQIIAAAVVVRADTHNSRPIEGQSALAAIIMPPGDIVHRVYNEVKRPPQSQTSKMRKRDTLNRVGEKSSLGHYYSLLKKLAPYGPHPF